MKGYLRTQLLLISRKAKEKFSDLTASSDSDVLTITIPTQLVRASKYVRMKKVEDKESEPDSSTPSSTLSSSPWLDLDEGMMPHYRAVQCIKLQCTEVQLLPFKLQIVLLHFILCE